MKRFRFTLQPVATVRDLQEMRARDGFTSAIRRVESCRQALAEQQLCVAEFVTAVIARRSARFPGVVQASFLRAYAEEVRREQAAAEAMARAEKDREAARQRWIEAHLQVRLIEKLRTRARGRHAQESFRFEQNQLDDRQPRGGMFSES